MLSRVASHAASSGAHRLGPLCPRTDLGALGHLLGELAVEVSRDVAADRLERSTGEAPGGPCTRRSFSLSRLRDQRWWAVLSTSLAVTRRRSRRSMRSAVLCWVSGATSVRSLLRDGRRHPAAATRSRGPRRRSGTGLLPERPGRRFSSGRVGADSRRTVALGSEDVSGRPGDRRLRGRRRSTRSHRRRRCAAPVAARRASGTSSAGRDRDGLGETEPPAGGLDLRDRLAGPGDTPGQHLVGKPLLGEVGLGAQERRRSAGRCPRYWCRIAVHLPQSTNSM